MKHVEWTEDVQLSDGRMFVAQRTADYRHIVDVGAGFQSGWLFHRSSITAELPPPVGRKLTWEGNLLPVVLDIQADNQVYLVCYIATGAARREWKLPRYELYIIFRLVDQKWVRIPLEELPLTVRPNVFGTAYTLFIKNEARSGLHLNLKKKAELTSELRPNDPMRVIVRIPAPKYNNLSK